ncbi:MAG: IclR family transcriptional regulator [Chromatiaceae bacterium]|nr:IclR family transcriptional regulator [Chromatiaceae bacterium]
MPKQKSAFPTILRGFTVIEKIVQAQRPISAAALIDALNLPKPSVHRILQQLEEEGLIQREPVNRRYIPGFRLQALVAGVVSHQVLGAPRHAILQTLSDEIGETCNCSMLDGDRIVYFDQVETDRSFRIQLPLGSRLPLHCTASGKLLLAYMEPRQCHRLINAAPLQRKTDRTITDPELLVEELKRIADDGVGIDDEEQLAGVVAVAVPVFNLRNQVCFTIAVHAPKVRKPLAELRQYIPSLKRAAGAMAAAYCQSSPGNE